MPSYEERQNWSGVEDDFEDAQSQEPTGGYSQDPGFRFEKSGNLNKENHCRIRDDSTKAPRPGPPTKLRPQSRFTLSHSTTMAPRKSPKERQMEQMERFLEANPDVLSRAIAKRDATASESGGTANKKARTSKPTSAAQLLTRAGENEYVETRRPWPVEKDAELMHFIKHQAVKTVFHDCKFLATAQEEFILMKELIFNHAGLKKRVLNLSKEDQETQIQLYQEYYSKFICKLINDKRSKVASALRSLYLEKAKAKGKGFTANEIKNAARRHHLTLLDVETEDEEQNAANREKNKTIKKKQALFDYYVEHICGKPLGHRWKDVHFCMMPLQGDADKEQVSPVTPADEAFYVLTVENCENKWEMEYLLTKNGGKFPKNFPDKDWAGEEAPEDGQKLARILDVLTKYTTYKSGSNKYGGWNKEGRDRFRELRRSITQARARELNRGLSGEKAAAERLYEVHNMEEKLSKSRRKRTAARLDIEAVGFGGEDTGEYEATASDEEEEL